MTFTLHVDAPQWRAHLREVADQVAGAGATLVPVVKGNGYGFTAPVLCREAQQLGVSTVAVGTVHEAHTALAAFAGDVLVLEPFTPIDTAALGVWRDVLAHHGQRTIVTIAGNHLHDAQSAGAQRVRLEGATPMRRFGMTLAQMDAALRGTSHALTIEGLSLHLPIAEPEAPAIPSLEVADGHVASGWVRQCATWLAQWRAVASEHGLPLAVSVSHVATDDLGMLARLVPDSAIEVRIGTRLWLDCPRALRATGTVLAVHPAALGHDTVGYTQVDMHGHTAVLVVSGGTSHGVALSAPTAPTSARRRAIAVAEGFSEALGRVTSPFTHGRTSLRFAEPPHMHVSMLWSDGADVSVGDELECRVRLTTATFDSVVGLD